VPLLDLEGGGIDSCCDNQRMGYYGLCENIKKKRRRVAESVRLRKPAIAAYFPKLCGEVAEDGGNRKTSLKPTHGGWRTGEKVIVILSSCWSRRQAFSRRGSQGIGDI